MDRMMGSPLVEVAVVQLGRLMAPCIRFIRVDSFHSFDELDAAVPGLRAYATEGGATSLRAGTWVIGMDSEASAG